VEYIPTPPPHVGRIDFSQLSQQWPHIVATADTINVDVQGADLSLFDVLNWDLPQVVLVMNPNAALPGGQHALGNMTAPYIRALNTPVVRAEIPNHNGKLWSASDIIITTFSPRSAFVQNPATAMKIDKLGDAGVSDHEFTHLRRSWDLVGGTANWVPHVQSTRADNQIFFEPGRHFVDALDNNRSAFMVEWFENRQAYFKFGVQNSVTVVIEMGKITFRSASLTGNNQTQWNNSAFTRMGTAFPPAQNIQLPTFADVKAQQTNQNTRGP
jgi:hypothetical protein